jgi:hypothetical protein
VLDFHFRERWLGRWPLWRRRRARHLATAMARQSMPSSEPMVGGLGREHTVEASAEFDQVVRLLARAPDLVQLVRVDVQLCNVPRSRIPTTATQREEDCSPWCSTDTLAAGTLYAGAGGLQQPGCTSLQASIALNTTPFASASSQPSPNLALNLQCSSSRVSHSCQRCSQRSDDVAPLAYATPPLLVSGHVELAWLQNGGLAGDGIVVLVDLFLPICSPSQQETRGDTASGGSGGGGLRSCGRLRETQFSSGGRLAAGGRDCYAQASPGRSAPPRCGPQTQW